MKRVHSKVQGEPNKVHNTRKIPQSTKCQVSSTPSSSSIITPTHDQSNIPTKPENAKSLRTALVHQNDGRLMSLLPLDPRRSHGHLECIFHDHIRREDDDRGTEPGKGIPP
ncbi:hypothetical protein ACHAXS_010302 [Conticribra weissflogii]